MLPVVAFLVVNNWYAKIVVREKVSETYRNTLDIFVSQTDRSLAEINDYLYKMSVLDQEIGLLMSFPYESDNYMLTKIRIQNKIVRDVGFYNLMNTVFLYHENDIIFSTSSESGQYSNVKQLLAENALRFVAQSRPLEDGERWRLWHDDLMPGSDFLVRVNEVTDGLYVGAIISVAGIMDMLALQWEDGTIGESAIYHREGNHLAEPLSYSNPSISLADLELLDSPYQVVKDDESGSRYLVMNRPSKMADIVFNIMVPESTMLQGLPYFQKATYFMAAGLIAIFALYLFFIRHTVFKPLQYLISGMKKISLGMLDVRLQTNNTVEFVFLANTFNNMAEQIKSLRIGMYEEQLRAQQHEMKQLQAQINPHFYMNSLNIIYNFAALKDNDSVKKMSLHLADYFRFIMRVNRDSITLEEELKHIDNYIEIQKFRFPNKLQCEIAIPQRMRSLQLPALSLQPFVENAIIHGFVNRRELFRIGIEGVVEQERGRPVFVIRIRDNGVGFSSDYLERLNAHEQLPQMESSGLGIANVVQRLKLRFSEEADVQFGNASDNGGACIRIVLPLPADYHQSEEEQDVQSTSG